MNERTDTGRHPSDDLAAFALGALEADEEERVREHLAGCERCRAELEWLEPAVDVLPASVPQLEPPRSVKRELMRTVRADARAERGGWWSRRAGWITMRARPALAAAAVAVLGAGIAGYAVNEANRGSEPAVTQVRAEPSRQVAEASATLERSGSEATFAVADMPPLEGERVYQVWYGDGVAVEPAAAFTVDAEGSAETDLEIPAGTDAVLVTEESEPGLQAPEGKVLLSASLS